MKRITLTLLLLLLLPTSAQAYTARQHRVRTAIAEVAHAHGYGPLQTQALLTLAKRESTWNPTATNGRCKGLFQLSFNNMGNRWKSARWNTRRAIEYIKSRYGTPTAALAHSYRFGWY